MTNSFFFKFGVYRILEKSSYIYIYIYILVLSKLTQINFNGTNFINAHLTQHVFLFDPWPNRSWRNVDARCCLLSNIAKREVSLISSLSSVSLSLFSISLSFSHSLYLSLSLALSLSLSLSHSSLSLFTLSLSLSLSVSLCVSAQFSTRQLRSSTLS